MRTFTFLALFIIQFNSQSQQKVSINFNKNIELYGYIIELVDPADNDPNHRISKIIHQYPEDAQLESLGKLLEIAGNINYSTLTHLMYYLPKLPLTESFTFSDKIFKVLGYNSEQEKLKINALVNHLNSFYKTSNFEKVWNNLSQERKKVLQLLNKNSPSEKLFLKMERFYHKEFKSYQIVPSLTLWPAGFGVNDFLKNQANFIFGPLKKNYEFNHKQDYLNLTIHEFGHSFVNEVVLENTISIKETKNLFIPIKDNMTKQGYSDWTTCLIEHFVRAGEVIINEKLGNSAESASLLKKYIQDKKYIYLSFIVNKLKKYRIDEQLTYKTAVSKTINDLQLINP